MSPAVSSAADCNLSCPAFTEKINSKCVGSAMCHDFVCNPKYDSGSPGEPTRKILQDANAICQSILDVQATGSRTLSELDAADAMFSDFAKILMSWSEIFSKCEISEESRSQCWENLPGAVGVLTGFRAAFAKVAESASPENASLKLMAEEQVRSIDAAISKIEAEVSAR